jgi:hypothetical protein
MAGYVLERRHLGQSALQLLLGQVQSIVVDFFGLVL